MVGYAAMDRRTVQLQIAGQSYKVISSAPETELLRLAEAVNAKIAEVAPPGKALGPQAILLAAMSLAHELEAERERRLTLERKSRDMLRRVLVRIEDALDSRDGEPQEPHPS
jgi:cell division protein ZapA